MWLNLVDDVLVSSENQLLVCNRSMFNCEMHLIVRRLGSLSSLQRNRMVIFGIVNQERLI